MPDRDTMSLAVADLIEGMPVPHDPQGRRTTLDMVLAWLGEHRQPATQIACEQAAVAASRRDQLWGSLNLIGAPTLWPDALKALWLGEPVWEHLQRQAGWFQVVEIMLLDTGKGEIIAQAARPWRRVPSEEPSLEKLLQMQLMNKNKGSASDRQVTVLVGQRSRLAVRTLGYPPLELRDALQAICDDADALLEEPAASEQSRQRLIQSLLRKALFRSGPKVAPWNTASALRFLGLIGAVVAGLAALTVREEVRWAAAVAKLDAEPGIRVTGTDIRWGIRHIEGLRDGTSAEPADVLRRQGRLLDHVHFDLDTVVYKEPVTASTQTITFLSP